jgi:integrase
MRVRVQAKKQPSGKWRCQLYLGDEMIDGKRKQLRKSFTASTRSEAEAMADEYLRKHGKSAHDASVALEDAFRAYLDAKSNILSPSTIRGYQAAFKGSFADIAQKRIRDLDTLTVQKWINSLVPEKKPKTVKNAYSILTAVCTAVDPSWSVKVTLPKRKKPDYSVPSYDDVMLLADSASSNLRKAILLSAFCSLRRGEICALEPSDIDPTGWISVTKDMVQTEDGRYTIKDIPKTVESCRRVPVPDFVLSELTDTLVNCTPSAITIGFERLTTRLGMSCRFHDLRHFFASYLHMKGIPDAYIERFGGWKPGSSVMKSIYRNALQSEQDAQAARVLEAFNHEKKTPS